MLDKTTLLCKNDINKNQCKSANHLPILGKLAVKLFLIFSLFFIICPVVFGNPTESLIKQMIKRIKQMDIIWYELKWNMQKEKGQEFVTIFEGKEQAICKSVKDAMDNITCSVGNKFVNVHIAASGTLTLIDKDGLKEVIDITEIGFFPGGRRTCDAAFYSSELSNIIKDMIDKSEYKDCLLVTNDLFEKLSKAEE